MSNIHSSSHTYKYIALVFGVGLPIPRFKSVDMEQDFDPELPVLLAGFLIGPPEIYRMKPGK